MAKKNMTAAQVAELAQDILDRMQGFHDFVKAVDNVKLDTFTEEEANKIARTFAAITRTAASATSAALMHASLSATRRRLDAIERP